MMPLYLMIVGAVLVVLGFAVAVLRNDRGDRHPSRKP